MINGFYPLTYRVAYRIAYRVAYRDVHFIVYHSQPD